ncbi:MAG TPA: chorismate synthase [Candidatus Hydrogenedentes bacterium]|nr:chorismate synthase [Candidatus Hydrogenedentota bacterium]HOL75876.1 chorismate synthase [Candidatus Hydrogenedentota bacterium]
MLRFLTAGESHGRGVFCLLDGFPAGLHVSKEDIDFYLSERQKGYGRGGRQRIEKDAVDVLSGIRGGITLGSPILLAVWNRDFENWQEAMDPWHPPSGPKATRVTQPRPGHADLVGALKYHHDDCRNILERASARETAARVAGGALCRKLLSTFGIEMAAHVVQIGDVVANTDSIPSAEIAGRSATSEVRCCDPVASENMVAAIRAAKQAKDTLGGVVEVRVWGLPVGLGTHTQWDKKLDGRLAQALMSIQAVKGVEIGLGFRGVSRPGSQFHDEIQFVPSAGPGGPYRRFTNHLGGLEGSMTTGEELLIRVAKKPISTLMKPLRTVNMETHEPAEALVERSDTCAVPALAVIVEAAVAIVLAEAFLEKFGGDSVADMKAAFDAYVRYLQSR